MDTCLSAATDKDVRRFDWFCNLLAILSRPAVTLAFLRMGDALTLAQAALSASALVEKVHEPSLLTYRFSSSFSCWP